MARPIKLHKQGKKGVRYDVLTGVSMKTGACSVVAPFSLVRFFLLKLKDVRLRKKAVFLVLR